MLQIDEAAPMNGFVILLAIFAGCVVEGNVINGNNPGFSDIPNANGISCGRPDYLISVEHSHIVDLESKSFEYMERISVECDDWYKLEGGSSAWRCDENSRWVKDSTIIVPNPPLDLLSCRPKCGRRLVPEDAFEGQLSGAKKVKYTGGWPWMAFIDLGSGRSGVEFCGGVLVDEKTVITAAHCIHSLDIDDDAHVWLGVLDRINDNFNFTQHFAVPASRRFVEPAFDNIGFDADIAVLKLDRAVDLSYFVHPICVPTPRMHDAQVHRYVTERRNAIITGWGQTEQGEFSEVLMKTRLGFVNWNVCRDRYMNVFPGQDLLTKNMLCAGHSRNDACKGDSGSPLMTKDMQGIWYLNGIRSFGDERRRGSCGRSSAYGVYTDVSKFEMFLKLKME